LSALEGGEFDEVNPSPMEFEKLIPKNEIQLPKALEDLYPTTMTNYHK